MYFGISIKLKIQGSLTKYIRVLLGGMIKVYQVNSPFKLQELLIIRAVSLTGFFLCLTG